MLCCGFRVCRTLWIFIVVDVLSLKGRISASVTQAHTVVVTYKSEHFSPQYNKKKRKAIKKTKLYQTKQVNG